MSTEWFYTKRSLGGYIVYEDWDKPICTVNDEEHARVIAAAPAMLEAAELILKNRPEKRDGIDFEQLPFGVISLRAAIARAKGEKP